MRKRPTASKTPRVHFRSPTEFVPDEFPQRDEQQDEHGDPSIKKLFPFFPMFRFCNEPELGFAENWDRR
jgi:hypothetical protein